MTSDAPETKIVYNHRVACDGGESALGPPTHMVANSRRQWLGDMPVFATANMYTKVKADFLDQITIMHIFIKHAKHWH